MDKRAQFHIWYIIAAIFGILLLQQLWTQSQQVAVIPYSQFLDELKSGNVDEVQRLRRLHRRPAQEAPRTARRQFVTTRVPPDIADELQEIRRQILGRGRKHISSPRCCPGSCQRCCSSVSGISSSAAMANQQGLGGGFMSIGRSKAKVYVETDTKVTFDDVAGVDEAKEELKEIVDFLKNPEEYGRLGARMPKGDAAGRPARHRQDAAGARRRRRGGRAVLLDQRLGIRGDVRRRRRGARARSLRAGARRRRRRSSSSTSSTPWAARARRLPVAAATTRRSRPSTSCCRNSTASIRAPAWCCSPPPTGRRSSTRRCCAPGASTARCWSTGRTRPGASRSSRCI